MPKDTSAAMPPQTVDVKPVGFFTVMRLVGTLVIVIAPLMALQNRLFILQVKEIVQAREDAIMPKLLTKEEANLRRERIEAIIAADKAAAMSDVASLRATDVTITTQIQRLGDKIDNLALEVRALEVRKQGKQTLGSVLGGSAP